jgi:GMP synthase-like glutamine amidotransferase
LAICFSHQLINKAYGGKVENAGCGFIFGTDQVKFQESEMFPVKFRAVVDKYRDDKGNLEWNLLQSHYDEVSYGFYIGC